VTISAGLAVERKQMPELAETIRIVMDLNDANLGHAGGITIDNEDWMTRKLGDSYGKFVSQQGPVGFSTYGKNILIAFGNSYNQPVENWYHSFWELRLGMSGRFKIDEHMNEVDMKHKLFTMQFSNKNIHYVDYRKFFSIRELRETPTDELFERSLLYVKAGKVHVNAKFKMSPVTKKPKITEALDEGQITGIGNYLVNEGLGRTKMDHKIPFKDLDEKKYLYMTIQGVALEAYAAGGHSFNGGYIRPNGVTGAFRPSVYGHPNYKRETFRGRTVYVENQQ
jgi:formamidopyrimidine-DNA glycosylase